MSTEEPTFTVKKIAAIFDVSCCMVGACEHPPEPRPPLRRRLRWWLEDVWYRRPRVHFGPCNHDECGY